MYGVIEPRRCFVSPTDRVLKKEMLIREMQDEGERGEQWSSCGLVAQGFGPIIGGSWSEVSPPETDR